MLKLNGISSAAAFAMAFALAASASAAPVVYTYTGANFVNAHDPFTTAENVTGTVTFDAPLGNNLSLTSVAVDSFSFTSGPETLTNLTANLSSSFTFFQISTDASGNITGWNIQVALGGGGEFLLRKNAFSQNFDEAFVGANYVGDANYNPQEAFGTTATIAGTFTQQAAVPEPASWALMIGGLGLTGAAMRRRKAAVAFA